MWPCKNKTEKIKDEEENAKMVEGTSSFCGICGHFKPAKQEKI
jgi:mannose-6-phosphate isomerase class I